MLSLIYFDVMISLTMLFQIIGRTLFGLEVFILEYNFLINEYSIV
jgi:hypothetical protein